MQTWLCLGFRSPLGFESSPRALKAGDLELFKLGCFFPVAYSIAVCSWSASHPWCTEHSLGELQKNTGIINKVILVCWETYWLHQGIHQSSRAPEVHHQTGRDSSSSAEFLSLTLFFPLKFTSIYKASSTTRTGSQPPGLWCLFGVLLLGNIFLSRTGTTENCVMDLYLRMGTVCSMLLLCFSHVSVYVILHALWSFTERKIYKDPESKRRKTMKIKCCKMKVILMVIQDDVNA